MRPKDSVMSGLREQDGPLRGRAPRDRDDGSLGDAMTRRDALSMIGRVAGSAALYHAMTSLGFAAESGYRGPIKLDGDPKGASVLILGAGLAGMTAALELRDAGYRVKVLEFNARPGGRNWTLRGGDTYTELGGARQDCGFAPGLYFNPGPWRIPYHHRAVLAYCRRLGVALEPFIQLNHNAYLHASTRFDGRPQRIREIKADFQGHVSELLAKATQRSRLDDAVSKDDREMLLTALKSWGALDTDYAYKESLRTASYRGYGKYPGGGLDAAPTPSGPIPLSEILQSRLWRYLQNFAAIDFQTTMFQPVGGHGYDRQGLRPRTRRTDPLRRQGDADPARRGRRDRHQRGRRRSGRDAPGDGRLVPLHHPALDPQPHSRWMSAHP